MDTDKKKIIIRSVDAFGDNIILTGIPRDIHLTYPSEYVIDIRPAKPEFEALWRYNPHISPLSENDHDVKVINLEFGKEWWLMNERIDHLVNATYHGLSRNLEKTVIPQKFYGDLYFSESELKIPSLTESLFGQHIPYWIFKSGLQRKDRGKVGKTEHITKTWRPERYDELVEHFKGRVLFIQIGDGDPEPRPIHGAINLVNKTDVRALMLLMRHADGVLCTVTSHMHLSAAVPFRNNSHYRPAVVLAGGREPTTFFAYPNHQVLHTVGALSCCAEGGCNRWRVLPVGDGHWWDQNLCLQPVDVIPRCMEMISVNDVANAINRYYNGGTLSYLTANEAQLVANTPYTRAIDVALSEQQNRLTSISIKPLDNTKFDLHYINLVSRVDHRAFLEKNLSECGFSTDWSIKKFEGITPDEKQKKENGSVLSISELSRFLSHKECLRASLRNQHHCMIVEDDVIFSIDSRKLIEQLLAHMPITEWDILFTDIALPNPKIELEYFLIRKKMPGKTMKIESLKNIEFYGTSCYIINKMSKEKVEYVLFGAPPFTVRYDKHIQNKINDSSLNGFFTFPFLTTLSDFSYNSFVQDAAQEQKRSILNAFRRINWIESDEQKVLETLNRSDYLHTGSEEDVIALSEIMQALVSENCWR